MTRMTTKISREGASVTIHVEGRIDTISAPALDDTVCEALKDETIMDLAVDFAAVSYVSSAGLRTFLAAKKRMEERGGTLLLKNCSSNVKKLMRITEADSLLTIE